MSQIYIDVYLHVGASETGRRTVAGRAVSRLPAAAVLLLLEVFSSIISIRITSCIIIINSSSRSIPHPILASGVIRIVSFLPAAAVLAQGPSGPSQGPRVGACGPTRIRNSLRRSM